MKRPSEDPAARDPLYEKIIGLGEKSLRKSYYPELTARIDELRQTNEALQHEIAERRRAEEGLRVSEGKLSAMLASLTDHMSMMDSDLNILWANDTAKRLFGEDLIGRKCYQVYHGRETPCEPYPCLGLRAFGDEGAHLYETEVIDKDGQTRCFHCTANVALRDEKGNPTAVIEISRDITEHKRAEEALRNEKLLSGHYINSLPGMFYVFDEQRFVRWNKECEEVTGYSAEELGVMCGPDLFEGEDRRLIEERMRKVYREGAAEAEAELVTKDGRRIPYYFTGSRREFDGKPHLVGLGIDNTERKRAAEELREGEEKYRTLFEVAGDAIFIMDVSQEHGARFMECNERTLKLFGCDHRDQIIGKGPADFSPSIQPDGQPSGEKVMKLAGAITEGHPQCLEWAHQRLDGTPFEVEVLLNRIELKGRPLLQAVVRDITERKRAEDKLRRNEEHLRTMFGAGKDAMVVIDSNGLVELFNPAAEAMFGRRREEMLGRPLDCLMPRRYLAQHARDVADFFATGKPDGVIGRTVEVPGERRDGVEFPMEISLSKGGEGADAFVLGVMRDITERKRAEEERLALERQVQQAQKMESLGVLAGGIAHDFNNLLVGVLGYSDLALDTLEAGAPARNHISGVIKAAMRAADLAKQMLAYSGKGRFVVEALNLNELVTEMTSLVEVAISKKVVLKYEFAEGLPAIEADGTQIRQVVLNLITNAAEAIGDASGAVSIITGAADCDREHLKGAYPDENVPPGFYVFIEVSDSGCGMDEQTIARIFEPFFTTKFTGRGLGLAAVLGIIRGHNGALKIYSEPGKGTAFKALFPALAGPAAAEDEESDTEQDRNAGGTILLVDDDETVLAVGKQFLERAGYKVLTAHDGRAALEMFQRHQDGIAAVILDLTMPNMDGDECFHELRRLCTNVRVILSSGYNEQELRQRFAGRGFAGFIQKPYRQSELIAKLRDALA